jgi:hypothetical protein
MKRLPVSRPSPAMIVAIVALIVALGGTAYAAKKIGSKQLKKNAVTTKKIKDGAVTTAKFAKDANAPSADQVGKLSANDIQKFCKPGTIKGSLVIDTSGLPLNGAYQNATGFNCAAPGNTTTSVQIRQITAGDYRVRFRPNPASGSAVVSSMGSARTDAVRTRSDDPSAPGETVFQVSNTDQAGTFVTNGAFSLVIF